jgi:hypothetical protein
MNPAKDQDPTSSDVERMRDALQKILAIAPPSIDASWGSVVEIAEAAILSLSRGREGERSAARSDKCDRWDFDPATPRIAARSEHQSAGRDSVLHCPHCNQEASVHETDWCDPPEYSVHCSNVKKCGASTRGFQNKANALRAWNRRSLKQEGGE